MPFSVIIPSRDSRNLFPCVMAIRACDPGVRIIAVDDGLDRVPDRVEIVRGVKPFVYARNVNIGIRAAASDDVLLLNDDALLKTPGGFTDLSRVAAAHPEYGVISSAVNVTGNPAQRRHPGGGLRDEPRMVCFVAVYIRRAVLDTCGLLDERYIHYGCDDDDYCFTVRARGLKLGIYDGCLVDHGSLHSTFRSGPNACGDYRPNLEIFKQKWGHDNWGRPCA